MDSKHILFCGCDFAVLRNVLIKDIKSLPKSQVHLLYLFQVFSMAMALL